MTTTAAAVYENGVLRPLSPLPLAEGTRVEVTVTDVAAGGLALPAESGRLRSARTGTELAKIWPTLAHLSAKEADAFEHDLAEARAAEGAQQAPAWE